MDILEKVKKIEEKALAKIKSKKVKPTAEIIQLPTWPEEARGFPNTAINLGQPGWDDQTGYGVINAGAVYNYLKVFHFPLGTRL